MPLYPRPVLHAIENVGPFFAKRTGPIVAIAAGPLSQSDAQTLLGAVNWAPSVTWNENTYFDKKNNIANLLVNIILLCIIVGAISLAAGFAFGGARVFLPVLLRKCFPGRVSGRPTKPSSFPFTWEALRQPPRPALRLRETPQTVLKCLRNIGLRLVPVTLRLKLGQFGRVVDWLCKSLKLKTFIYQKLLDTLLFRLIRFCPESFDGIFCLRWNYSPLKRKGRPVAGWPFRFARELVRRA